MTITVWPHARIKGWDGSTPLDAPGVPLCPSVPLLAALEYEHSTDAHFVPYAIPGRPQIPRLTKASRQALGAQGPVFSALVIDVDCPEAHAGEAGQAPDTWRAEQQALREALPEQLYTGMGWYETRGGYRLLWQLPEALAPEAYLAWLTGMRGELARHGIQADPLLDWTRCYRLPRVVRDGQRQDYPIDLRGLSEPMLWRPRTQLAPQEALQALAGIEDARPGPYALPQAIGAGDRNRAMASLAGKLRHAGAEAEEILAGLEAVNATRCNPPLERAELERIARSIAAYEPGAAPQAPDTPQAPQAPNTYRLRKGSDVEVMELVISELEEASGGELVADRGHLWRYSQAAHYWQPVHPTEVHRAVMRLDGEMIYKGDGKEGPKLVPLLLRAGTVPAIYRIALSHRHREHFFSDAPRGLTMQDGFLTLNDDDRPCVLPHDREHRSLFGLPYAYRPGARPAAFLAMLEGCFQGDVDAVGKVQLLREWVGVALLGQSTRMAKGLILIGEGANGKSTVQEIVTALFPRESVTSVAPQAMDNEYRRAELAAARLNCVSEMPEADLLESVAVKAILSGDPIDAREIREAPFRFEPVAGHLFSANNLPAVRDLSHGFWRRWLVLGFHRVFTEAEQDRGLARRIIRTELAEVASWCLDGGAEALKRGRFVETTGMRDAAREWQQDANPVAAWAADEIDHAGGWTSAQEAYQRYSRYASENGYARMSLQKFGRRISALGFSTKRTREARGFDLTLKKSRL